MKTIQLRTQDQTLHTIFVKHITYLSTFDNEKGTMITLACGNKLTTLFSLNEVLNLINNKD